MLLDAPSSFRGLDGRWVHHFRQSDVTRFRQCPELHRTSLLGLLPEMQNDSAAVGTAMHAGADYSLKCLLSEQDAEWDEAVAVAVKSWHDAWHSEGFNITEIATIEEGALLAADCLERWWDLVLLKTILNRLEPVASETQFIVTAYEDHERVIKLAGTQDFWYTNGIMDWKSSNRQYSGRDAWKYERSYSSVQHVLYSWARVLLEGTEPESILAADYKRKLYGFTYVVLPRNPGKDQLPPIDMLHIVPTAGDARFLLQELLNLALLIEAQLPSWPLGPSDWWCSNKWCPNWDGCRGLTQPPDPWGLMAKVEVKLDRKRRR